MSSEVRFKPDLATLQRSSTSCREWLQFVEWKQCADYANQYRPHPCRSQYGAGDGDMPVSPGRKGTKSGPRAVETGIVSCQGINSRWWCM